MGHILPWPNHGGHIMWNPWQQEDEDVDHKDWPTQIKTTLDQYCMKIDTHILASQPYSKNFKSDQNWDPNYFCEERCFI